jgi:hypothetical protein
VAEYGLRVTIVLQDLMARLTAACSEQGEKTGSSKQIGFRPQGSCEAIFLPETRTAGVGQNDAEYIWHSMN